MHRSLGPKPFLLPTPVLLVGTYDEKGRPNIMTASWGGICSSQPPTLGISIRKDRWTHSSVLVRRSFTVSIPSRQLVAQADFAGIYSGCSLDKFAALGLTPVQSEHVDAPIVAECPVVIDLSLLTTVELGSHTLFVGEVIDVRIEESCLREDGFPDPALIDPLLFAPLIREYWTIGAFEARAFSAGHALHPLGDL